MRRSLGPVRASVVVVAVAAVLQACGGGGSANPKGASAPSAPAEKGYSGAPDAAESAPPAPPPPPPPASSMQPGGGPSTLQKARGDFETAQRELDVAASDCRAACRALGSMDRAAGHLCDLASGVSDRARCEEAKTKLYSARDRVRTTCGTCPGGASVERSAPVPSVP